MAVAGLHNISAFGPSLFIESQTSVSRQRGEHDRPRTRASSVLQMWRELEGGEHMVSNSCARNEGSQGIASENDGTNADQNQRCTSQGQIELDNDFDDGRSVTSDQSSDLGEVEREKVRQIIQEWMNSGVKSHSQSLNVSHVNNCSMAQWLGENERGRVRIIREWVQMNNHQSGSGTSSPRDEVAAEIGSQFEQVRDGMSIDHSQNGERKALRRFCGRQALIDLLMRSQRDREKELQGLSECKPVSGFAYRNRIQSLLRGRFLRNERLASDKRTASNAASELGLLRQRHTVSDLREEILSRLDDNVRDSTNNIELSSEENDPQPSQSNSEQEIIDEVYDQSELVNEERETNGSLTVANSESTISEPVNQQNAINQIAETSERVGSDKDHEEATSTSEFFGSLPGNQSNGNRDLVVNVGEAWLQETVATEGSQGLVLEHHAIHDNYVPQSEASDSHEVVDGHFLDLGRDLFEDYDWEGSSAQAEEQAEFTSEQEERDLLQAEEPEEFVTEYEESESEQFYADHNGWVDDATENMGGDLQVGAANQLHPERHGIDEQNHAQEPHDEWHEEAVDDWYDTPSGQDNMSIGRADTFYIPDDDNVHNIELRELLSRRRVSNLLRSGFRESLNQLIQSYVERQGHASFDWDMDETSSYPSETEQEQQQENVNPDRPQINMEGNPFAVSPAQEAPSQPHWLHEPEVQSLPLQNPHHHVGASEWDIINELKIDMAVLQQRMNDMQRMLQTCMEMQVELQRSVRQEVSAALNRCASSSTDTDVCRGNLLNDESKWDNVRRGICCLCCNNNINSLLYRCGHMCICSKCAEQLVHEKAKCPMCQAPVVEVIRAFSIQ